MQGDLGRSLWRNTPVTEDLLDTMPITFELGLLSLIVALTVAIPIGIYSAMRQDTVGDYVARSFSLLMLAVPGFWLGTLVMVFPSVWWRWSPPLEYTPFFEDPIANLTHMIVPAILLGLSMSAVTMRMTRTMMLEVLRLSLQQTGEAQLLEEVLAITHGDPVGPDSEAGAGVEDVANPADPSGRPQVRAGTVHRRCPGVGDDGDVFVGRPHEVRQRDVFAEDTEIGEAPHPRRPDVLNGPHELGSRLEGVRRDRDVEFVGDSAASPIEVIRAGRRPVRRQDDPVPSIAPVPALMELLEHV